MHHITYTLHPTFCRWAKERYAAALAALVSILRGTGATSSSRAMLRPELRAQARRTVGDTGASFPSMMGKILINELNNKLIKKH